jgi:NAD(P) transhydrogenase
VGKVVKHGNVTCVGYTDIESRMGNTSSYLFGGNVTNLLLSMEDKKTKSWVVNLEDPAVRSICVAVNGEALAPYVPPAPPVVAKKEEVKVEVVAKDPQKEYMRSALFATAGTSTVLGLVSMVPNAPMMTTFALSCWVGNSCVQGVSHALHSPLMAMTNAISGMTIVGGMLQLGGGILPGTIPQALAAGAVGLSAINLAGGTIVTKKMLDMFRRPDDPPEYNHYYLLPGAAAIAGSGALFMTGAAPASLAPMLALGSALGCVGGISCLSTQQTARLGISVGMSGIGTGLAATLAYMNPADIGTYGQLMLVGGSGAAAGTYISTKIGPAELPQAVAAFHSYVHFVPALCVELHRFSLRLCFLNVFLQAGGHGCGVHRRGRLHGGRSRARQHLPQPGHLVSAPAAVACILTAFLTLHNFTSPPCACSLGAWMGSITATGSVIAYGKLAGSLDSAALSLPGRDYINMGLVSPLAPPVCVSLRL